MSYVEQYSISSNSYSKTLENENTSNLFEFYELEPGEVIDIILDKNHPEFKSFEDIGKVKIRLLYSQKDLFYNDITKLSWAKPLNSNMTKYPLKHEIVICAYYIENNSELDSIGSDYAPKNLYYSDIINIFNSVNNNATQDISLTRKFKSSKQYNNPQNLDLGDTFKNNENIYPLKKFEGDITFEGRSGNSIRFGSHIGDGKNPIIKIRNKQRGDVRNYDIIEEDLDLDGSSIWITSDQNNNIKFTKSSDNQKSIDGGINEYNGNQIIIASDRIIFNAKNREIYMFAKDNINLSSKKNIGFDSDRDIVLNSKKIYLGKNAEEKIVLGDTLVGLLDKLLDTLLKVQVPTGTGPSGPPLPPYAKEFLSIKSKLKTILSKQNYTL